MTENLKKQRDVLLEGGFLTQEAVCTLAEQETVDALCEAATDVTAQRASRRFDMCSIINAKSGACSEDCKWCSQSAHYHTSAPSYTFVGAEACVEQARISEAHGVSHFSLVASGRRAEGAFLEEVCEAVRTIKAQSPIAVCVSLGLLDEAALRMLIDAGVTRYHCNLETAPSCFPELCSTHGIEEKVATLQAARRVGMEICSGGIIGMGETMAQRIEMAFALRSLEVMSIPINILCPIPGTPLAQTPPLSESEILATIALFRLSHPEAYLRFGGGRNRLSLDGVRRALKIGINAALVGDLLTTVGSCVEEDKRLIKEAGYRLSVRGGTQNDE